MSHTQIPERIGQPAVGADWSFVPSSGDRVQLQAITARLVTSAVVANRVPAITVTDIAGNLVAIEGAQVAQAAAATVTYCWRPGNIQGSSNTAGNVYDGTIPGFWLPAGCAVGSKTLAIDVGDQWSLVFATYLVADALLVDLLEYQWAQAAAAAQPTGS